MQEREKIHEKSLVSLQPSSSDIKISLNTWAFSFEDPRRLLSSVPSVYSNIVFACNRILVELLLKFLRVPRAFLVCSPLQMFAFFGDFYSKYLS